MKYSIVVPAYNEEGNIEKTVFQIDSYMKDLKGSYELIVVNDGSKDKTPHILKSLKESYPALNIFTNLENKGKGYSIRKGILEAKGDYILFLDADMATPISEISKMFNDLDDYDLLLGSRRLKESRILHYQPPLRLIAGKIFAFLVSSLVIKGISDTQCGFKMYKNKVAKNLANLQTINGWAFDVEHLFLASKLNYSYKEVPIIWEDSKNSSLKLFPDALLILKDIFKVRINSILGYYKDPKL